MSFKGIQELRKAGKLDEALQMTNEVLATDPDNIWNKRGAAWVYYEYLKKYSQPQLFNDFIISLAQLQKLQLPEDEKMVFDNSAWQIGKIVFGLQKEEPVDYGKINGLFQIVQSFHFTKPSDSYTFLYKAFHKGYQNWSSYLSFAEWWDFENFSPENFLEEEYNGKKSMSIVEQAYIAYSKKLLEGIAVDAYGQQREIDQHKIMEFLPRLSIVNENHPDYKFLSYFKAKLLLSIGDEENVLSSFLPFAKQKRNDYWVWQLMAEIFKNDKEIQFACYCKALSLKTREDFLVKLRLTMAGVFIEKNMYDEAKTEIESVIQTRKKEGWKITNQIIEWQNMPWYDSATTKLNNKEVYKLHLKKAEEILFQDILEEVVVVEFVNENKNIINFVKDKNKFGFFNYSSQISKPQIGDILNVRFNGEGQNDFFKILSVKKVESDIETDALRDFNGVLKLITPHMFGFADNVFIDPKTIEHNNLKDNDPLMGKAILSYNKKKNEWGWKAVKIKNQK
jgi:hypothetical protein